MAPVNEKVAIVTGASSGMGEALTRHLIEKGWKVALFDIREKDGLVKELGSNAKFFEANVADYDSQGKAFQAVYDTWERIDALLANAGIVDKSSLFIFGHRGKDTLPPAPDLLTTDVDWKGVIYGTQLAIHFMRKNSTPGGNIICTASAAALYPHESYPEYNGAKAAVLNFVFSMGRLLKAKESISIGAVLPGIVKTAIIPPEMIAAVSPDCLTPIDTIVNGYQRFLDEPELAGCALEGSVNDLFKVKRPEYLNGKYSERATTVWEPLFKLYHGENSDLPGAIQ